MKVLKNIFKGVAKNTKLPTMLNAQESGAINTEHDNDTSFDVVHSKIKNHRVAGVAYYEKNIISLAIKNPQYDLTKKELVSSKLCDFDIYQYNFKTEKTELIPEPTNEHDPNAIKVIIDGKHVGYIKKGSCSHIHKLLKENRIETIQSKITGGNYKFLWNDGIENILEREFNNYSITISIIEK